MTAMNRIYSLYSEEWLKAQLDERKLGLRFVHSSVDRLIRGNGVGDRVWQR